MFAIFRLYIRSQKVPKSFLQKNIKKLSSQTENYYFGAQTLKIFMQQMFSFFQDDFAKSEIGHYFCPFFTFPKKSWKKIEGAILLWSYYDHNRLPIGSQ
jgi:hypothetical protein